MRFSRDFSILIIASKTNTEAFKNPENIYPDVGSSIFYVYAR